MPAARMPRQRQPSGRLRPWDVLLLTGAIAVLVGGGYIWEIARRGQATAADAEAALLNALNEAVQEEVRDVADARIGAPPCVCFYLMCLLPGPALCLTAAVTHCI